MNDYSPNNWRWDPNDHLPVYVLRSYFVDDLESPTDQIEYAYVSFPRILPERGSIVNTDRKWMAATDLVPIRKQCESLF